MSHKFPATISTSWLIWLILPRDSNKKNGNSSAKWWRWNMNKSSLKARRPWSFPYQNIRILMINSSTKLASQSWQSPPGIQSRRSDAPNPRCTPRSQPPSEQPAKPARLVALMIEMHVGNGIDLSRRKPYMIHIWRFPEIERNFLNFLNHPNFRGIFHWCSIHLGVPPWLWKTPAFEVPLGRQRSTPKRSPDVAMKGQA